MRAAAETEYNLAEEEKNKVIRQIDVSFDGTYMTRGHTSKVGVVTLIGCETGKALGTDSERSKTHKRLKECLLIRRNRTKHANF